LANDKTKSAPKSNAKSARDARLSAALRENLKRRKRQAPSPQNRDDAVDRATPDPQRVTKTNT
jgi:hypothetical protein